MCGELAGDPVGVLLLLAMGYRRFSMNTHNIARIKYVLRQSTLSELTVLLTDGLKHDNPHVLRGLFARYLKSTAWAVCCAPVTKRNRLIDNHALSLLTNDRKMRLSYDWGRICSTMDIGFFAD